MPQRRCNSMQHKALELKLPCRQMVQSGRQTGQELVHLPTFHARNTTHLTLSP